MSELDYTQEIPMDDSNIIREFKELIREVVREEVRKLPYARHLPATVVSVGSGVANIKLLDSDNVISNVKVRSGLSLSINDVVYVLFINNTSSNFIIDFKK